VSKPIEAVKQSIRDAVSDDPQPDWKDSLGDALDVIEAVEAERDDLLAAMEELLDQALSREPMVVDEVKRAWRTARIAVDKARTGGEE